MRPTRERNSGVHNNFYNLRNRSNPSPAHQQTTERMPNNQWSHNQNNHHHHHHQHQHHHHHQHQQQQQQHQLQQPPPPSQQPMPLTPHNSNNHQHNQQQQQQQQLMQTPPNQSTSQLHPQQQQSIITRQIYETFLRARQSNETYIQKARLRERLYNILRKCFKSPIDLYIVGSSINNLGNNNSDVDMCLVISERDIDQTTEALPILQFVRDAISQYDFVKKSQLILAKVPLLRFEDASSDVVVDLNVNNSVGIRNTHLINCYTRLDRRVQPLVIVIKLWARKHRINDAYNKTLSSYSLVLMVIHYLQCGCNPPVLPCLQKIMPDIFSPSSDIKRLDLLEELPNFLSRNSQTLEELLIGFLYYFSYMFNFAIDVISVRLGCTIDKETARYYVNSKNTPTQWRWICIEEPFDRTNTARSVWDERAFIEILGVFRSSHYRLKRARSLNSII